MAARIAQYKETGSSMAASTVSSGGPYTEMRISGPRLASTARWSVHRISRPQRDRALWTPAPTRSQVAAPHRRGTGDCTESVGRLYGERAEIAWRLYGDGTAAPHRRGASRGASTRPEPWRRNAAACSICAAASAACARARGQSREETAS